jgi:hypothetical protein
MAGIVVDSPLTIRAATVRNGQCGSYMTPLVGITQDNTAYVSPWLPVTPGTSLDASLNITELTGTLSVIIETANAVPDHGSKVPSKAPTPRFLGSFPQINAPGSVQLDCNGVTGSYIRIIATPGQAAGQTASWNITGEAIVPYTPLV